jgi:protocatechuate 4,5-dioxygenase, alpha chain
MSSQPDGNASDPLSPPNTYIFDGQRARQGYRLNRMAMTLVEPANRAALQADEEAYLVKMGLSEAEKALVRGRDWAGMLEAGGNIYLMYKLAGSLGISLPEMGAQMRGESLEEMRARLGGRSHTAQGGS